MPDAPRRLLVVSPNWLGDAVMAQPAVQDFRRHDQHAHLGVAVRRGLVDLWRATPGMDEVIPLAYDGRLRHLSAWASDAARIAARRFDCAVLLPNSFASAWVVRRAGVPERWGYRADLRTPLLTRAVPKPPKGLHQAEYYQALMHGLGVETRPSHPSLGPDRDARDRAAWLLHEVGLEPGDRFVVLAPGAAYGKAKQWPPERFAEVATCLRADGLATVIIGSGADQEAAVEIAAALAASGSAAKPANLVGQTTLATLMGVLAASRACVSNDSGAMHLAAAVGVPVTAVFGPTNARETAPLPSGGERDDPRRVAIVTHEAWCRPCMLRECPVDHGCMTGIDAARVVEAVRRQVQM